MAKGVVGGRIEANYHCPGAQIGTLRFWGHVHTHIMSLRRSSSCQYALRRAAAGTSLISESAILLRVQAWSTNDSLRAKDGPTWSTNRLLAADFSRTSLDPAVLLPKPASPRVELSPRCGRHQHPHRTGMHLGAQLQRRS
jgi:hypothetical protein